MSNINSTSVYYEQRNFLNVTIGEIVTVWWNLTLPTWNRAYIEVEFMTNLFILQNLSWILLCRKLLFSSSSSFSYIREIFPAMLKFVSERRSVKVVAADCLSAILITAALVKGKELSRRFWILLVVVVVVVICILFHARWKILL